MKLKTLNSFESLNSKELQFIIGGTDKDSKKKDELSTKYDCNDPYWDIPSN